MTLRVPYPMGFFAKSLDGRIDDANAGWKGRGLYSTYATRAPQHIEGGKGTDEQSGEIPAEARSAGEVRFARKAEIIYEAPGRRVLSRRFYLR